MADNEGNWLEAFKGQHITVLTTVGGDERTDTGTLLQIGSGWLQVVKDNGDMILVPSTAIRQVKLLNMTHTIPGAQSRTEGTISSHVYEPNAQTLP
jgi:hypothetical protein